MANPYTFGFLDQLVRINFPQQGGIFLAHDGNFPVKPYYSTNGIVWPINTKVLDFIDFIAPNGSAYLEVVGENDAITPTFVLGGSFGGAVSGFNAVIIYSFNGRDWLSASLPGFGLNSFVGFLGVDPDNDQVLVALVTDDDDSHTITSVDGITWTTAVSGAEIYQPPQTNTETGTKVIPAVQGTPPGNIRSIRRIIGGGSTDIPLNGRRVSQTAFGVVNPSSSGAASPGEATSPNVFVAVGGGNDSFGQPVGPELWSSTDDGLSWTIRINYITGTVGGDNSAFMGNLLAGKTKGAAT